MKFQNIVVVFITSSHKKKAFDYGVALAKGLKSHITVLKCLHKQPPTFGFFETKGDKKRMEKDKKNAEKSLEPFEELGEELDIPVKTKVLFSDPISRGIVSYTNQREVDLVVLDSPKLKSYEQTYYGNTICELHKGLKCPLLILD